MTTRRALTTSPLATASRRRARSARTAASTRRSSPRGGSARRAPAGLPGQGWLRPSRRPPRPRRRTATQASPAPSAGTSGAAPRLEPRISRFATNRALFPGGRGRRFSCAAAACGLAQRRRGTVWPSSSAERGRRHRSAGAPRAAWRMRASPPLPRANDRAGRSAEGAEPTTAATAPARWRSSSASAQPDAALDPLPDGSPLGDQGQQPRPSNRSAPSGTRRRSCRVVQRHVEPAQVDQQAQVLGVGFAVLAVVVVSPRRPRQPARALVEPDGVGRDADTVASWPILTATDAADER